MGLWPKRLTIMPFGPPKLDTTKWRMDPRSVLSHGVANAGTAGGAYWWFRFDQFSNSSSK